MYRTQTNSEAISMRWAATPRPPFQPKYSPVMTEPTPIAQMWPVRSRLLSITDSAGADCCSTVGSSPASV